MTGPRLTPGPFTTFIEPTSVGRELGEMPLFLEIDAYLPLILEPTYHHAWEAFPKYWREVNEQSSNSQP